MDRLLERRALLREKIAGAEPLLQRFTRNALEEGESVRLAFVVDAIGRDAAHAAVKEAGIMSSLSGVAGGLGKGIKSLAGSVGQAFKGTASNVGNVVKGAPSPGKIAPVGSLASPVVKPPPPTINPIGKTGPAPAPAAAAAGKTEPGLVDRAKKYIGGPLGVRNSMLLAGGVLGAGYLATKGMGAAKNYMEAEGEGPQVYGSTRGQPANTVNQYGQPQRGAPLM
jgi:hypothetical protein